MIHYLFDEEKLDFIQICHFRWNRQSRRVIEKCGLQYVKTTLHQTRYGTEEITLVHMIRRENP